MSNKPKVLFSNPPWWAGIEIKFGILPMSRVGVRAGSRWPFTTYSFSVPGWRMPFEYLPYPFFMGYAASYAAKHTDAEIILRDSITRRESCRSYWRFIESGDFDYVFIESATPSWDNDRAIIEKIHALAPSTKIVLCGPVTAEKSEEILSELPVHACIQGEYDLNSVKVIEGASGILSHDLLTQDQMNSAPPPMSDPAVITKYYDRNPRGVKLPQLQLWGSRGCPFKCIFCVWPATMTGKDPDGTGTRTVRYYHPDHLEPYIRDMVKKHGFRSVYFDDDTFNLGSKHTLEMCEMMKRIGLPWSAMCRSDTIKLNIWDAMKEAGCYGVKVGFESGNQWVNDHIVNKQLDLKFSKEVVHHLKKIGLAVHGTFTIGLPGETPEQMRETMEYAESLPFDSKQISGTAEIEGTPLHNLRKTGKLDSLEQGDHGYNRAVDGNRKMQQLIEELRVN